MDSSRRAVESYWRSRMIDAVTSDEDKVAPVYKLEEVCELLRSSHVSIVKEVSEFILKRLEHKSPIVKQKALRLIKYAVGKSGVEFRREMQRHSVAVRQLFHYKGKLDPLKGDALNKAVRDTAQETISTIFSDEDSKPAPAEDINKRIQGFGSTTYEMPSEDKKSFLSASIKNGLSSFTQGNSVKKNDNGSYKSPHLRRSLTMETEYQDRYEPANENHGTYGSSKNVASGPWNQDSRTNKTETTNGGTSASYTETKNKTHEERLLETIVTSGGVRLQPTRDAIQIFLLEAAKLDAVALSLALEAKLQSPMWQVRMKAVCVLESILRKNDHEHFSIVATYFSENIDVLVRCSESPQASLREKANKVLSLLGTEQGNSLVNTQEKPVNVSTTTVQLPDLIDTDGPDDYSGEDSCMERQTDQNITNLKTPTTPLIDDLFGDGLVTSLGIDEQKNDDPFADVSFLPPNGDQADDIFAGMSLDKQDIDKNHTAINKSGPELLDMFGSNSAPLQDHDTRKQDVNDLMGNLSINEDASKMTHKGISSGALSETIFAPSRTDPNHLVSDNGMNGIPGSQVAGSNGNIMFPTGTLPYNAPPGFMYSPVFPTQQMNYSNMGNFLAQQQLLATMSNFQQLGNLNNQNVGISHVSGSNGGYSSALPDIFQPNVVTQVPGAGMNSLKKEDTKAFDFISDHIASARDPKRVA